MLGLVVFEIPKGTALCRRATMRAAGLCIDKRFGVCNAAPADCRDQLA
jgi:hypothetical protein